MFAKRYKFLEHVNRTGNLIKVGGRLTKRTLVNLFDVHSSNADAKHVPNKTGMLKKDC